MNGQFNEEKVNVDSIIKELESGFGETPESKTKVLQLFKGLIFSDEEKAKKYMKALDKATTQISKDMTEKKKESYLDSDKSVQEYLEEKITEADPAPDIQAKNVGILNIPKDKDFSDMPIKHFIDLAKSKGKGPIAKAINNIARWQKNKAPDVAKKASDLMTKLENNKEWKDIPSKSEK